MKAIRVTVSAGWHERHWCPVSVDLPSGGQDGVGRWVACDLDDGTLLPAQVCESAPGVSRVCWIVPWLAVHQVRRFELRPVDSTAGSSEEGVKIEDLGDGTLGISIGQALFTRYNYGDRVVRPYLYPVYAEGEVGITRNWPMVEGIAGETSDHPHHKGVYTAQGEVNGVDNWGEGEGHGYQIHKGFSRVVSGDVAGGFTQSLEWTDADHKPNMTETRSVCFYAAPVGGRVFDYDVTLHASLGDVTLGDTKEGGLLSVRVASSMDAANDGGGIITNSHGGTQENETWGKLAAWCDYSGPVAGKWYGVTLMDHPTNPRYPTPWHVRGYGLMTANCFGFHHFTGDPENRHDLVIPSGQSVSWRYRVLIHDRHL